MAQMSATDKIDVSIEHKKADPDEGDGEEAPQHLPRCGSHYRDDELRTHLRVCPQCGHHFPVRGRERIEQLADGGTFVEDETSLRSGDPLDFFDLRPYTERLAEAEVSTGLGDAMITGTGLIEAHPCRLAVMDFSFMGGSMGSVVGEKFARACEHAAADGLPLVSVSSSGGARMQEGILALMQLPKTICALEELHDSGGVMLSVITHPTTGGLLASFASLGDVIVAEPGALMSFAGPRVVAQTTREKLPDDFGLAESNLRFGHIDAIVQRSELRPTLAQLMRLFERPRDDRRRARPPRSAGEAERRQAAARHAALGGARAAAAPARAAAGRHLRRGDLAAGRAGTAPGAAVHARLRRAHPGRLLRAPRRPGPDGRPRDRGRDRQARGPHDRADRPPEGPRPEGADEAELRHGVSRRATARRCG